MERTNIIDTLKNVGETLTIQGWVDTKRDHGKLVFLDLRDRSGKVQCVGGKDLGKISIESVISITGIVKQRPDNLVNPEIPTGSVEVEVTEMRVLNEATFLPLPIDTDGREINEESRIRYRYLDLRRQRMLQIMGLRSRFVQAIRQELFSEDFWEIETPLLTKSTKEGARDFVVPSRLNPGKFYALPQSPQQYKQLLMTAGTEKYFQVARCIRDEDLRADRGFEFTQLDLEMSFVEMEDIMSTIESAVTGAVKSVGGKIKREPFPRLTYAEAIEQYGADKFDMRTEEEKQDGVLAFAWVYKFPFFKKVDKDDAVEVKDGKSGWTFTHNPFSSPLPEHLEWHLNQEHIGEILTAQYDLVCNGYEVGGGSVRAHQPEVLKATYQIMGYSEQQIQEGIGHMLEAFTTGTPPHGGIALGIDRLIMLLANEKSLKEVIAFPMTSSGKTSIMDAPSPISQEQLDELGLNIQFQLGKSGEDMVKAIKALLTSRGIQFNHIQHEATPTSEAAAKVRGTDLNQGVKALILKGKKSGKNYMVNVPADSKVDFKAVGKAVGEAVEMESPPVIKEKYGLEIGGIPPFGNLLGLANYFDQQVPEHAEVAFNCGLLTESIIMPGDKLVEVAEGNIGEFSKSN